MRFSDQGSYTRLTRCLVLTLALCLIAASAQAQKLSVQGDRFAVDGTPRFLRFMSLFGAMAAPNIGADLHFLKGLGFDGVRIWPNLDQGPQIFAADGTLKPDELTRLRFILDQAKLERMIVDVSFTYEHTPGLTAARARLAIMAAADALRSYDNIMFDIQNERNVGDRRFMSEADMAAIYAGVKSAPANVEGFLRALTAYEQIRRRDGAFRWSMFRDVERSDVYLETFLVSSWAEHLRQHERFTLGDRELEERIAARVQGQPAIRHLVQPNLT
jgi:Transmembrane secretion effector